MVEGEGETKTLDELTAGRPAVLGERGCKSSVLNHKWVELGGCLHGDLVAMCHLVAMCRCYLSALFACLGSDSAREVCVTTAPCGRRNGIHVPLGFRS